MTSNIFRYTQFGCGLCAPTQWLNLDSSPLLRLQKLPFLGNLAPSGPFGRFPTNVQYGDVVQGLAIPNESVELLYCSHVLEHLSLADLRRALRECHRILKPQGIFRLVVPDLEFFARQYVASSSPDAALEFMRLTFLGKEERSRSFTGFLRGWLGGSQHLWMWDYKSLETELRDANFTHIHRAYFNDSAEAAFAAVEDLDRWINALGIECQK